MLTHFAKQKATFHKRFFSTTESLTFQAIPEDRLVTERELYTSLTELCRKHGERRPNGKNFEAIMTNLVDKGFVKRISGESLERFVSLAA